MEITGLWAYIFGILGIGEPGSLNQLLCLSREIVENSKVKEGSWLYDDKVLTKIAIEKRNFASGSGDCDDLPEVKDDKVGEFYFVLYFSPTEENRVLSETGPFNTVSEAETHCNKSISGKISWN